MPEATATTAAATATTAAATTTTAAATTTAATAASTATAAAPAWHGLGEADTAGLDYVKNKGWQNPGDVIKSYQGAEKLIGRDPSTLLVVPRADDPASFLQAMDKLGRPADAKAYEFAKPEGGQALDDNYVAWARQTFHTLGLPAQTVKALSAEHNKYIAGVMAQQEKDYNLSVDTDKKTLLKEWGGGHERMMNTATSAAKALGFTGPMMDAMERSIGYAGTMKFMADLGKRMSEDGFVGATNKGGGGGMMTPDEAKAEWGRLQTDPNFKAALADKMHPGNGEAQKKQTALFKIMYPEG